MGDQQEMPLEPSSPEAGTEGEDKRYESGHAALENSHMSGEAYEHLKEGLDVDIADLSAGLPPPDVAPVGESAKQLSQMEDMALSHGSGMIDEEPQFYPDNLSETPAENDFFAGKVNPEAADAGAEADAELAAEEGGVLGTGLGLLGMVGGGIQFAHGLGEFGKGTEQGETDGIVDMGAGTAGVVAGGLGTATALGLGGAAVTAAAPVAAAVGAVAAVEAEGQHRGEDMHLFGKDAEGNYRGAFEAAADEGQDAGHAVDSALGGGTLGGIGGAATAGLATAGLEVGAAGANLALGIDGLGASSGFFGTAQNADGEGTHNMGAFEATDHLGQAASDALGGGVLGTGARVLTDVAAAPLALIGDGVGMAAGAVEGAGHWIADLF